ncbi:hypothetical protein G1C96_1604 [Bifidobacterium sp. DSM 109958]|uniref:Uncharacterized protein n=1 Tax=Bifidobacterium moraviense TaxID=2675323 RepID=A0A7Y0F4P4_9BIFI|nr:DUF6049 family protein [Bifidobacterium sp. DSM 109958]NMN01022.1 hypothetical protein [Bifidobacterium sp. DSM 109958]
MTLRRPNHNRGTRSAALASLLRRAGRIGAACAAMICTLAAPSVAFGASSSPAVSSSASQSGSASASASNTSNTDATAGPDADSATDDDASAGTACTNAVCITADDLTPVVTSTSGYHVTVTVTNATADAIDPSTLNVSTNPLYTFTSRVDMQGWAEGEASIPTRTVLGSAQVEALAPGATAQAQVDVTADNAGLTAITTWGPKPLRISLSAGTRAATATLNTFLTRSTDGVRSADTPPLNITVAMPLTAGTWQTDDNLVTTLTTTSKDVDPQAAAVTDSQQRVAQTALITRHPMLQAVADPLYLSTFDTAPRTAAVMQPGYFDITAAATQQQSALEDAGIASTDWSAASAAGTDGGDAIAWQGQGAWTKEALTAAARQGYRTVIAGPDFEASSTAIAHTGSYAVSTDAGDVTVLAPQTALTRLAQNQATSDAARAEATEAGQMARFIAQSAFYQMEQPYADRVLLVTFTADASLQRVDQMMTAMEEASWITLTDLDAMRAATVYRTGDAAAKALPSESGVSAAASAAFARSLDVASSARRSAQRFADNVLETSGVPAASAQSAQRWMERVGAVQHALIVRALDGAGGNLVLADRTLELADALFDGVRISPSDSINVVSETAQMPVTVSNNHDFPVRVRVDSKTDSMQIVTSREVETVVPAHGEAQVTFTIRVLTSGHATAHLTLLDADGERFGDDHQTHISSKLQISDMSGTVIIALAVALGVLGLWRQFHRKKDPDE